MSAISNFYLSTWSLYRHDLWADTRSLGEEKISHYPLMWQGHTDIYTPVAQLVQHWAAMLEVASLTPAGPTRRVFKYTM